MSKSATRGTKVVLQNAKTTGNGDAIAIPSSFKDHTFYVIGNGAVGAGAITFETADNPEYTGTWMALVNDLATPTANPLTITANAELIYKIKGVFAALRARISTTVTVGTVTVEYLGA